MTEQNGFGTSSPPSNLAWQNDSGAYTFGQRFKVTAAGLYVKAIRFYLPDGTTDGATSGYEVGLYAEGNSTPIATAGPFPAVVGAWNEFELTDPEALTNGAQYVAAVLVPAGYYGASTTVFASGDYDPPGDLYFYSAGRYNVGSSLTYPTSTFGTPWYGVDVTVTDTPAAGGDETAAVALVLPVPQLQLTAQAAETVTLDLVLPVPRLALAATGPDQLSGIGAAREAVAAALSQLDGLSVRARPFKGPAKPGDGWVTIGRVEPAEWLTTNAVTLVAAIVFGHDELRAEERLEDSAAELVAAVSELDDLATSGVMLEPVTLVVGQDGRPLYGAALTLTVEVSA